MKRFEVKDDGIYEVEETYSPSCFSGEYASRIMKLVIPKDVLVEALEKWGLIEDPCKDCDENFSCKWCPYEGRKKF